MDILNFRYGCFLWQYCLMNLWFLHGIFFTGSRPLQIWLYYPEYPFLIFILGIILLLPLAIGCDYIQKTLYRFIGDGIEKSK